MKCLCFDLFVFKFVKMSDRSVSVWQDLKDEYKNISEDLKFERNLNNILESIRNNSLILIQNCKCLTNEKTIKVIKHLNTIYTDLKTNQNISKLSQSIQNDINMTAIEMTPKNDSQLALPPRDYQNSRVLRNSGKQRPVDNSLKTADNNKVILKNKSLKSIKFKANPKSKYSLVTEMLGIKDKSTESDDNSEIQEISNEVMDCKPDVMPFFNVVLPSSAGPSFPINDSLSTSEDLTSHSIDPSIEDEDINEEFICNVCNETFIERIRLQNHLSKKHRIKGFECEICQYKTFSIYHLKRHKTSHTSEKPFQCTIDGCGKWFKTKEHLYEHKNLKHSNDNPFECSVCDFKTSRKASYNYHMSLHNRLDPSHPFKCPISGCNKTYKKRIYLDSHKIQCHQSINQT